MAGGPDKKADQSQDANRRERPNDRKSAWGRHGIRNSRIIPDGKSTAGKAICTPVAGERSALLRVLGVKTTTDFNCDLLLMQTSISTKKMATNRQLDVIC